MDGFTMKMIVIAAAALLTACASQEAIDRQNAHAAIAAVAQWQVAGRPPPEVMNQAAERDRQAAIICRARGNAAGAMPAFAGFGSTGAVAAGMQQGWAAASVEQNCIQAYRATGIMPAL